MASRVQGGLLGMVSRVRGMLLGMASRVRGGRWQGGGGGGGGGMWRGGHMVHCRLTVYTAASNRANSVPHMKGWLLGLAEVSAV